MNYILDRIADAHTDVGLADCQSSVRHIGLGADFTVGLRRESSNAGHLLLQSHAVSARQQVLGVVFNQCLLQTLFMNEETTAD